MPSSLSGPITQHCLSYSLNTFGHCTHKKKPQTYWPETSRRSWAIVLGRDDAAKTIHLVSIPSAHPFPELMVHGFDFTGCPWPRGTRRAAIFDLSLVPTTCNGLDNRVCPEFGGARSQKLKFTIDFRHSGRQNDVRSPPLIMVPPGRERLTPRF